jgi:Mg/Co/Ni transporter MgtE
LIINKFDDDDTEFIINKFDNDDTEFIINKFDDEENFIFFEDENEKDENISHAKIAKHDNLRTNHSINDEFNSRDFF